MQQNGKQIKTQWLALHLIPGLGNRGFKNLIDKFGSPSQVFSADISDLIGVQYIRRDVARKITHKDYALDPEKVLAKLERLSAKIITYLDASYPPQLREIQDPPMVLYARGRDIPRDMIFVGVVGSRNPTHYGVISAKKIAQGLARSGVGVVSGMARGIDSAAHWGCLDARGFTIAVQGTGIDSIYPRSNHKLHKQIVENGLVLTEFPLGTSPEPKNFPIRNRIISGLSRAITVVEATRKSGSLITASLALEQGRDVYAVPGSIHSFKSMGCHFLIKQGAALVENSDDILHELGLCYEPETIEGPTGEGGSSSMEATEETIYNIIGDYPLHIDQIARQGNIEPGEVSNLLTKMEIKGLIRQLPGKMFIRNLDGLGNK